MTLQYLGSLSFPLSSDFCQAERSLQLNADVPKTGFTPIYWEPHVKSHGPVRVLSSSTLISSAFCVRKSVICSNLGCIASTEPILLSENIVFHVHSLTSVIVLKRSDFVPQETFGGAMFGDLLVSQWCLGI